MDNRTFHRVVDAVVGDPDALQALLNGDADNAVIAQHLDDDATRRLRAFSAEDKLAAILSEEHFRHRGDLACVDTCEASRFADPGGVYRVPDGLGQLPSVGCGPDTTCSCTSGTCGGATCGGSTCSATCTGDSCGNTCGDSCGHTSNIERWDVGTWFAGQAARWR